MKHSTERFVLNLVLWLVKRYLFDKYRLVTPADLEKVVQDYLSELPKLGIELVYKAQPEVGESNDKVKDLVQNAQSSQHPHV